MKHSTPLTVLDHRHKKVIKVKKKPGQTLKSFLVASFIAVHILLFVSSSKAESEDPLGGYANCTFNGKIPLKRFKTLYNNLLSDKSANKSVITLRSPNGMLNIVVAAIFNTIPDGKVLLRKGLEGTSCGFIFSNTPTNSGITTEIYNPKIKDIEDDSSCKVFIYKVKRNLVYGSIRMNLRNTLRTIKDTIVMEEAVTKDNGDIFVRCVFAEVPLIIEENTYLSGQ